MRLLPSVHTFRHVVLEIVIVIVGVLAALAVSDWQQQRHEHRFAVQQLESLTQENNGNLSSLGIVRDFALPKKMQALEQVIATLDGKQPLHIQDLHAFIAILARSAHTSRLWYQHSRFDALRSTGSFRALGNPRLERYLNGTYNGIPMLMTQVNEFQSDYPILVSELIPARYQSDLNPLREYVSWFSKVRAPVIHDPESDAEVLASIEHNRARLLRLARAEAAAVTARWYVLTRLKHEFTDIGTMMAAQLAKESVAPRHRDGKGEKAFPARAHST